MSLLFRLRNSKASGECPTIEKIIHFDAQEEYAGNEVHFNEVRKFGREWLEIPENMVKFEKLFKSLTPESFANICYTSSTTAIRKALSLLMVTM